MSFFTCFFKVLWEKEKLLVMSNFSFSQSAFYPFENFLPFSSNLELLSANPFTLEELEESRMCCWGTG